MTPDIGFRLSYCVSEVWCGWVFEGGLTERLAIERKWEGVKGVGGGLLENPGQDVIAGVERPEVR